MAKLTADQINKIIKGEADKSDAMAVSFDDIDSFGNKDSLREMIKRVAAYNKMLSERITLVNESLTATVPFTRENLYLFCAYTGSGKSTVAANISYPLWKQNKKVLVISNEESAQDVIMRIACLEHGSSFNDYKKGLMSKEEQMELFKLFPSISDYVKVVDVNFKNGITTKLEGVKNALSAVKTSQYSCVLIDYYQLIQYSVEDKSRTRYDVLNDLRIWMGQYIKDSNIPIVLFVQLHSTGKKGGVKEMDARIKECPAVVEPATVIIEVVPDFETKTSAFLIHKDRFGAQGKKIICPFEKGRFLRQPDDVERFLAERKLEMIESGEEIHDHTAEE